MTSAPPAAIRSAPERTEKSAAVKTRFCSQCGNSLHPFTDTCDNCGTVNELKNPWYTRILGAGLFLALILFVVDFPGLIRFLSALFARFTGQ